MVNFLRGEARLPEADVTLHVEQLGPGFYYPKPALQEAKNFLLETDIETVCRVLTSDPGELIEEEQVLPKEIREGKDVWVVDHFDDITPDGIATPSTLEAIGRGYQMTRRGRLALRSVNEEQRARQQGDTDVTTWLIYDVKSYSPGMLTAVPLQPTPLRIPLAELHQ